VPVDGAQAWESVGQRLATFARLHADGALAEVPCPACGWPTLSGYGAHHVCVVCHWQDDGSTRDQPDRPSALNDDLSLREAAVQVAESGVAAAPITVLNRPQYFLPNVRAARAELVAAYERLRADPGDPEARTAVYLGRARVMRAIVNEMR
jgi:hypothetical protein